MKKLTFSFSLVTFSFTLANAQEPLDSIFTNADILAVNIKEVTEETVKFSYPGEEVLNTLTTNTVSNIVFRTGRIQTFAEENSFREVKNGLDWEYVTAVQTDRELKGLYQLDQVNAKAKAATGWGSVGKMENRAKRKLLIETAMNGGNVVFLTQQNSSTRTQKGTSSSVMDGVAYGSTVPNFESFKSMVDNSHGLRYVEEHSLGVNNDDMKVSTQKGEIIKLENIEKSGHMIYVNSNFSGIDDTKFRVSYFDNDHVVLVYRTKKQLVNLILMH